MSGHADIGPRAPQWQIAAPPSGPFITPQAGHGAARTRACRKRRPAGSADKNSPGGGNHGPSPDAPRRCRLAGALLCRRPAASPRRRLAQSGEPIKIGFSMALTGPLAPNGKQALLGAEIWAEEINAKGGLLGRKVELVHYDDQSNPANVPGIYTKLLDSRQSRHRHGALRHQPQCAGASGGDAEGQALRRVLRARHQQRVPLPEIFLHAADRSEAARSLYRRLLPGGGGAKPEAEDGGAGLRRRRVRAQRLRRRPQQRQGRRLQHHLRQDFPAGHDRLLADHARAAGRQRRPRRGLLLSAQLGRHRAIGNRAWLQAEDDRRRHGRIAGAGVQGQAQIEAQRHRQLRDLGAVAEADGAGRGVLQEPTRSAPRRRASIRSAIISAAGVMPTSS